MFTGLVEDVGSVRDLIAYGNGIRFWVDTALSVSDMKLGESIACDGVCLTAEEFEGQSFRVTAGIETLNCTNLGTLKSGQRLHLERALLADTRMGGHLVAGHVDGVAVVRSTEQIEESLIVWFDVPDGLEKYIAVKGSVCVDGVSLTVNEVEGQGFRVNLIPHTLEHTHMGQYCEGHSVNLEVDLVARYVERLLQGRLANEPK